MPTRGDEHKLETGRGERRTQHDVGKDLVVGHLDVADSDTQAKDLLKLELDRRANLGDLVVEVLRVRDGGGELASCGAVNFCFCAERKGKVYIPLERPGPRRRGICLMRASEARNASYFLASFLTSFLFLLSFFKSSTDMYSRSICLARSMSAASARMQIDMRGRGTLGNL